MSDPVMNKIAREWLAARDVIAKFFLELSPHFKKVDPRWPDRQTLAESNAAAILARLASHKPPILLQFQEDES